MSIPDEIILEAAQSAARYAERKYGAEPGELLSIAWIGARRLAATWDPSKAASAKTWCHIGALTNCANAVNCGLLTGQPVRRKLQIQPADLMELGLDPPGREDVPSAPLEAEEEVALIRAQAEEALALIRAHEGARVADVVRAYLLEGRSARELAQEMGVSSCRVTQIVRQGVRAARDAA